MQYTYPTYVGATRVYFVFFHFPDEPIGCNYHISTNYIVDSHLLFHKSKILLHTVDHVGHCALRRIHTYMATEIVHVILLDGKLWQPTGCDFSILK